MTFTLTFNTFNDFLITHLPLKKVHPPVWSNPESATGYAHKAFYMPFKIVDLGFVNNLNQVCVYLSHFGGGDNRKSINSLVLHYRALRSL